MDQEKSEALFARCFTKEELEFLKKQPKFAEVSGNVETVKDVLNLIRLGADLIRQTWSGDGKDSEFTPRNLNSSN